MIVEHQGSLVVHGDCEIGDDCILLQNVTLGVKNLTDLKAVLKLGRNVNVGAGVVILGAVRIGDGAWLGENAVVTSDVPDGATAVGIPARIVPCEQAAGLMSTPRARKGPKAA